MKGRSLKQSFLLTFLSILLRESFDIGPPSEEDGGPLSPPLHILNEGFFVAVGRGCPLWEE